MSAIASAFVLPFRVGVHPRGTPLSALLEEELVRLRAGYVARNELAELVDAIDLELDGRRTAEPEPPAPAVDPSRMARALSLELEQLADGRYIVTGGQMPHVVDLEAGECDCADARIRGRACKHQLRARLASVDADVIEALRTLVSASRA